MKIAVICSHSHTLYWYRLELLQEFIKNGHEVYGFADEPEELWSELFAEKGITYKQISISRNSMNPFTDIRTYFSIRHALKELKPDKVLVFHAKAVVYGSLAANHLKIYDVYPLMTGLGSVFIDGGKKREAVKNILVTEYRVALKNCPVVFFQNSDDKKEFINDKIINKQRAVLVNGSGVNLDFFQARPLPRDFSFLCISRLIRDKGVYEYLEACRIVKQNYPQVKCMLVGPMDSNPTAIGMDVLQPYLDQGVIEYYGETDDIREYMEQCSVFVLPSYREGTPKTNLEAMATGRPIITTDAPGCRETVDDGLNGFLVPIRDINALADKMIYLIRNPHLLQEMARMGREKAEKVFDSKKVNRKICREMRLI